MGKPQVDLLLAKRRTLVLLPFSLINLGLSIIMIVFSGISSYRLLKIRDDYIIERDMFNYKYNYNSNYIDNYINSNEKFCIDTIDRIRITYNFTIVFGLNEKNNDLNRLNDNVSACLAFSITAVIFLVLFTLILGCFMCIYASPSDDKIREKPSFAPNKKHCATTCFVIFKMIAITLIDIYIIIFTLISFFSSKNLFNSIYRFHKYCVMEKLKFKETFIYCWNLHNSLKKYVLFALLFVISDIISDVFIILSKNYNVWSFILSKISRGKFEYEKVEEYKGIILPENEVVKDNQEIDNNNNYNNNNNNNNNNNINNNDDNDYDNNIIINNNEFPDEIRGAINDSEESFLENN
jgi:hypothetical protein